MRWCVSISIEALVFNSADAQGARELRIKSDGFVLEWGNPQNGGVHRFPFEASNTKKGTHHQEKHTPRPFLSGQSHVSCDWFFLLKRPHEVEVLGTATTSTSATLIGVALTDAKAERCQALLVPNSSK